MAAKKKVAKTSAKKPAKKAPKKTAKVAKSKAKPAVKRSAETKKSDVVVQAVSAVAKDGVVTVRPLDAVEESKDEQGTSVKPKLDDNGVLIMVPQE